jgi:hypothetical protein
MPWPKSAFLATGFGMSFGYRIPSKLLVTGPVLRVRSTDSSSLAQPLLLTRSTSTLNCRFTCSTLRMVVAMSTI